LAKRFFQNSCSGAMRSDKLRHNHHFTMIMGPRPTRNCVIVDFNRSIPILLAVFNAASDGDKNKTNRSLASEDIAFVVGASTGRRRTVGVEASLELHFWESEASPTPAFSLIVNLPSHWSVRTYMAALYVTVQKTSALVPRKVEESWGCVSGPFVTINEVAFLYHRSADNILEIIKRNSGFAYVEGGCSL
jgi:hypothetical protein